MGAAMDVDVRRPNAARMRDVWLGGKDNYEADRQAAARLEAAFPDPAPGRLPAPREMAVTARLFAARAIGYAVSQGCQQVIDVRCGLPVPPYAVTGDGTRVALLNAHRAARETDLNARCAYVDSDEMAFNHVSALLCPDEGVAAVQADPFAPAAVLGRPELGRVIDLAEPVCVLLGMLPHYMSPGWAHEVITGYTGALAPGSYVIISTTRIAASAWDKVLEIYGAAPIWNHSPRVVRSFFLGLRMVAPGLCDAHTWRPGWQEAYLPPDSESYVLAGVGLKP